MGSPLDLGRSSLRRCSQHKLVLQRDGKCALCRESARRVSGRSIGLGLLATSLAALGAFAFHDLLSRTEKPSEETQVRVSSSSAPRVRPAEPAADAHSPSVAQRVGEPLPVEDQFLRSAPAPNEQTGESPPPPRAYVETEPSAPDHPQDFALPRETTEHAAP